MTLPVERQNPQFLLIFQGKTEFLLVRPFFRNGATTETVPLIVCLYLRRKWKILTFCHITFCPLLSITWSLYGRFLISVNEGTCKGIFVSMFKLVSAVSGCLGLLAPGCRINSGNSGLWGCWLTIAPIVDGQYTCIYPMMNREVEYVISCCW